MTDGMMNLRALVEKPPDSDLLREMIGFAADELEVGGRHRRRLWREEPVAHGPAQPLSRARQGDARRLQRHVSKRRPERRLLIA